MLRLYCRQAWSLESLNLRLSAAPCLLATLNACHFGPQHATSSHCQSFAAGWGAPDKVLTVQAQPDLLQYVKDLLCLGHGAKGLLRSHERISCHSSDSSAPAVIRHCGSWHSVHCTTSRRIKLMTQNQHQKSLNQDGHSGSAAHHRNLLQRVRGLVHFPLRLPDACQPAREPRALDLHVYLPPSPTWVRAMAGSGVLLFSLLLRLPVAPSAACAPCRLHNRMTQVHRRKERNAQAALPSSTGSYRHISRCRLSTCQSTCPQCAQHDQPRMRTGAPTLPSVTVCSASISATRVSLSGAWST
jgi:hypothetical protein